MIMKSDDVDSLMKQLFLQAHDNGTVMSIEKLKGDYIRVRGSTRFLRTGSLSADAVLPELYERPEGIVVAEIEIDDNYAEMGFQLRKAGIDIVIAAVNSENYAKAYALRTLSGAPVAYQLNGSVEPHHIDGQLFEVQDPETIEKLAKSGPRMVITRHAAPSHAETYATSSVPRCGYLLDMRETGLVDKGDASGVIIRAEHGMPLERIVKNYKIQ